MDRGRLGGDLCRCVGIGGERVVWVVCGYAMGTGVRPVGCVWWRAVGLVEGVFGCVGLCCLMSCHVMSCHVMSCHVMSRHVMSLTRVVDMSR